MNSYEQRMVLEEALDKLNGPKGWLILAGSVAGMIILSQKGVLKMGSYEQRSVLEKLINRIGDN